MEIFLKFYFELRKWMYLKQNLQPGLSEALFAKQSGAKKRERKTEKAAQKV